MSTETKPMDSSTKPEVRVVNGYCNPVNPNHPKPDYEFRNHHQRPSEGLFWERCALVIGDDAIPMSKVVEMVREIVESVRAGDELTVETIAAKYGITNI